MHSATEINCSVNELASLPVFMLQQAFQVQLILNSEPTFSKVSKLFSEFNFFPKIF